MISDECYNPLSVDHLWRLAMFEQEQQAIEAQIRSYLASQNIPEPDEFQWNSIPFSGESPYHAFHWLPRRHAQGRK
jgi:hypothetical protein